MSSELAAAGIAIAAGNMWKLSLLGQVLDRAEHAQVPVVVLKGAAFLGWLYRLEERPMADVDLLIQPNDRGRFMEAMRPHGHVLEQRAAGVLPAYEPGQFSMDFKGLALDLHVHILNSPWLRRLVPLDEDGLWARASRAEVSGHRALRLSVEDQLLHLAAHMTFHHSDWRSDHPHRINDAVRLVSEASLDWDLLCRLARAQKMRTAAWLLLSNPALSSYLPTDVLASLRPGPLGTLRIRLAARLARGGDKSLGPVLLTDHDLGLLRAFGMILTPSRNWLRRNYAHVPTVPGQVTRHYLRVGSYAIERLRRAIPGQRRAIPERPARRSIREKVALALRIWFWFFAVHLELWRRPLPKVIARLGTTSHPRDAIAPRLLGQIIVRVLRVGRYQPRCLINALVHYRMLVEQGQQAEVVIGLQATARRKDAHAWIEIGGADVGPPPGRGDHLALARYS